MIAKIKRGQKLTGLMVYLLGPGEHNEHKDRHIVAGSPTVMRSRWLEHFDGPGADDASREVAHEVAHEIEIPRALYGTKVRMRAKPVAVGVGARELGMDVVEPAGKGEKGELRDAPVWHCVLALQPQEELSDERWQEVIGAFMDRMGFGGTADGKTAPARWAAVRHGQSGEKGEGQDHIHIAASLVREDGSKVNTFDFGPGKARGDWKRADEVCGELEREFGLQVLASREQGGQLSGNSRAEIERAKRTGAKETERERMRRTVRALATAAESEADFVRSLREAGLSVAPRWKAGGREEVTGYSVRLRRSGEEVGPWVGGGTLAKDLTITALREQQGWADTPEGRAAAAAAWQGREGKTRSGRSAQGRDDLDRWRQAATEMDQWRHAMESIPHGDRAQWAWMAGQAAGVFAAWSEALEGDQPGPFAAAAQQLTRSAQPPKNTHRYRPTRGQAGLGNIASALLSGGASQVRTGGRSRPSDAEDIATALLAVLILLLLAAIAIAVAVARAHRGRGELTRALAVEEATRDGLDPIHRAWQSDLDTRRHQWDRDAAGVFIGAAQRRAGKVLGPEQPQDKAVPKRRRPDWDKNKVAAAGGPLGASQSGKPDQGTRRRVYYTDLSPQDKAAYRARVAAEAAFAKYDIQPRSWTDERLEHELAERRTEVGLLAEDIAARKVEGPYLRQARVDNASLTAKAEKIPAAQEAQKTAAALARQEAALTRQRDQLQTQLDAIGGHRMLAKKKLQGQITETDSQITALTPTLAEARTAAATAAEATGTPEQDWTATIREAAPQRQKYRVTQAARLDQRELSEDQSVLNGMSRQLKRVEDEHTRREQLTPQQRATEARTRGRTTPQQARPRRIDTGIDPHINPAPPHIQRPDRGQGGPEL